MGEKVNLAKVVAKTVDSYVEFSIDIPRIRVVPKGEVTCEFVPFDLDASGVHLQPVEKDILIQHLHDQTQHRLVSGDGTVPEKRLEDYLVRGLIECDDISYDDHAELLYKLAGQLVAHLKSYLPNEDDVKNVLQYHQRMLVNLIHSQMQGHYRERAIDYEPHIGKGFITLHGSTCSAPVGESPRNFRVPVEEKLMIRGMLFGGFKKCLHLAQKFQSDSERRFAVVLENDSDVLKWFKPAKGDFQIFYQDEAEYVPDFAVESKSAKYLCEPKRASEMTDDVVRAKAKAAAEWCEHATAHARQHGAKPWVYLLIPHDAISESKTLQGLASSYVYRPTT
jgi:type III restriction enzyme